MDAGETNHTPTSCSRACDVEGYTFSALQSGSCSCARHLPTARRYHPVLPSDCGPPCAGEPKGPPCGSRHGSTLRTAVFIARREPFGDDRPLRFLGCFKEDSARHSWQTKVSDAGLSTEKCVLACLAAGKPLAGLKGSVCLCGDELPLSPSPTADDGCGELCPGEDELALPKRFCGSSRPGRALLAVYAHAPADITTEASPAAAAVSRGGLVRVGTWPTAGVLAAAGGVGRWLLRRRTCRLGGQLQLV